MSEPATNIGSPEEALGNPSALQKWLAVSCQRIDAQSAVLAVKQGDKKKLLAQVPREQRPEPGVGKIVERALQEKRVIVRLPAEESKDSVSTDLYAGISLRIGGRPAAMVFRLHAPLTANDDELLKSIADQVLHREEDSLDADQPNQQVTSLAAGQPESPAAAAPDATAQALAQAQAQTQKAPASPSQSALVEEQSALIESVAIVLDQADLGQALHSLTNGVASHLGCQRVCVGLNKRRRFKVDAVSGLVDFDAKSALMVDIADAMAETREAGSTLTIPVASDNQIPPQCHAALAEQLKHPALLSVPLADQEDCVGVLFLERDRPFTAAERGQVERLAILVAPLLALKQMEAMGPLSWIKRYAKRGLQTVFGRKHLGLKFGLLIAALLMIASTLHTQMFRVNADAVIEASVRRAVVSSFPSFLTEVERRAGDLVQKGDVLARLDIEDLKLERIRLVGEQDKLSREYRATLAQRDRSQVRVLAAQRSQTQAQIDLVDSQISRAELVAPVDGVVISGDLSQALGSPVERGELLFEVASLEDYRLVLYLDETDVGWISANSAGNLRLRSLADQTYPFRVTGVTPVSESKLGTNRFRVEAQLTELPESFRPGMEGVAKVDVEPRSLAWIWTHSFVQWVKLQAWKFGGIG